MDFSQRYTKLNAAQKQAVDTIDGSVMVIAGPGTGKTELLSVRVANILKKTDTLPENILCLTFTESGAAAMRERLTTIIGKDAYKVAIHTFHSFGTEIINQNREYFYRGATFQPADDISRYETMRAIFDELDYKNPLASTMNGEYTYQGDATRVISELKRSGLTSDELMALLDASEAAIDASERILAPVVAGSVSKGTGAKLAEVLPDIQALAQNAETLYEFTPLITVIADSLERTVEQSETEHPTKPITAWKKKWFIKDKAGNFVFKSRGHLVKLRALAYVYFQYLDRMEKAGLYDYDDMILQVLHAMEVHDDLRFNLQEKYLYIMVDEFQDTNNAQMRILHSLTDNPISEGNPNILIVGDDDQAIYSFQGADISNILRFQEVYTQAKIITLTDNYRSVPAVIDQARSVIVQGEERLEDLIENVDKKLVPHRDQPGFVELHKAATVDQERHWIVQKIKTSIEQGTKPSEIAVLTRKHSELQGLLPYFNNAGLSVQYERQDNLLDQPPVATLELLSKVTIALSEGRHDDANFMMPQLLAHPAWGLEPVELWKLSTSAYEAREHWLTTMTTTPRFVDIHAFIIGAAALATQTPLEQMLDTLMGRPDRSLLEQTSPFFTYFFAPEKLEDAPSTYLDYLSALRTIRAQLRDYRQDESLTLASFLEFINLHRRLGTRLVIRRDAAEGELDAVHLMTAHKSKGLEFDEVYIFNSVDNVWGEKARSMSRNINYPENLPLAPAGDSMNERLRLYYVAMTRAKNRLYMTFSDSDDKDRSTLIPSFLSSQEPQEIPSHTGYNDRVETAELAWYEPLSTPTQTLEDVLMPSLKKYKLSATHLNTFLDVTNGGPRSFLLDNLLHFPGSKSAAASYGSAIHQTLQNIHTHVVMHDVQKPLEDVLQDFETNLSQQRMTTLDFETYLKKGSEQLQAYLAAPTSKFTKTQKSELNFSGQEVFLGDAHLTGMIDVADIDKENRLITVCDYKTGKPIIDGKARTEYEKIKLHKYRQQLMFYKLLVEGSRDYGFYTVPGGSLAFVEPSHTGSVEVYETTFEREEVERFKLLIEKVWQHITTLNLPDTSGYDQTYKGLLKFEDDLLNDIL